VPEHHRDQRREARDVDRTVAVGPRGTVDV
jgi:hypothetical protein